MSSGAGGTYVSLRHGKPIRKKKMTGAGVETR